MSKIKNNISEKEVFEAMSQCRQVIEYCQPSNLARRMQKLNVTLTDEKIQHYENLLTASKEQLAILNNQLEIIQKKQPEEDKCI